MRKPQNIIYGVEEIPPRGVTALSGLQHVGLMSIYLVYPVLVAKASDSTAEVAAAMIGLTLLVLAVGTILQAIPIGPFGSGYLCQPIPTVVYLLPSLAAARHGGLALVFGMTIAAGALEMALSRALRHLRPMFPPEIAGLVVLLVGIATGVVGFRVMFGVDGQQISADAVDLLVAMLTLGLMVALNVWGRGGLRLFCVLIGMAAGYAITAAFGRFQSTDLAMLSRGALVALPDIGHVGWTFDAAIALPFAVAAVAATLKATGNITTCQKASDADWVRADMQSISRGVLADGFSTVAAGGCGAVGLNSSTAAVGLAGATGVLSRHVAYWVAAILVALAFVPKLGLLFYIMPRPVAGAALVFSSTFIIVNGLEIITSRLLDARRTFVIGLALMSGLAVDIYPVLLQRLPGAWPTILGTSLVLGTILGLTLNLVFRLGVRRVESLTVPLGPTDPIAIEQFMDKQGATWGARRDVIERAKFNVSQSIETIMEGCDPQGPLEIRTSFDEFNLDVRVSYDGMPLELPEKRPTNEEIMESEDGHRRLAGFMLRRYADRVRASFQAGRSTILFHFDH